MTLSFELDLDDVEMNQQSKYLSQRSTVSLDTHTDRET